MKLKAILTSGIIILTFTVSYCQQLLSAGDCSFKVTIVKDRYLFGKAYLQEEGVKRIKVNFTPSVVNVFVPYQDKAILLAIENSNCRAYCPRVKRVRQLHSGDKRLLIKLLKQRKKSLMDQLSSCSFR